MYIMIITMKTYVHYDNNHEDLCTFMIITMKTCVHYDNNHEDLCTL